jgi:type II secretory pathway pseudopilin PulG
MKRPPLHQRNAGFTIVEALVVLVVTTMLVLVITNYMLSNTQQSILLSSRDTILKETEQSLDLAANDIRLSANADDNNRWADVNSPSGSANQFSWQSNGSTLVLATAAQAQNGNIIFSDTKNYITQKNNLVYFVKNGTLYKRTLAAPASGNAAVTSCPAASASTSCPADKELLHDVNTFNVKYLNGQNQAVDPTDARSVELRVAVSKKVFGQPQNVDYTTRMVFRND